MTVTSEDEFYNTNPVIKLEGIWKHSILRVQCMLVVSPLFHPHPHLLPSNCMYVGKNILNQPAEFVFVKKKKSVKSMSVILNFINILMS